MSRNAIIAISAIVLIYSIYINSDSNSESNNTRETVTEREREPEKPVIDYYPQPENLFSPYDDFFGKGVYDNSSNNIIGVKNSNETDAVVLLVDAYSNKKIRNEYIRKGEYVRMTGVPNGTYYLQWSSGNNWSPVINVGNLIGGFQTDQSFSKTQNRNDWMEAYGNVEWTITLYSVSGGDVETQGIDASEFAN